MGQQNDIKLALFQAVKASPSFDGPYVFLLQSSQKIIVVLLTDNMPAELSQPDEAVTVTTPDFEQIPRRYFIQLVQIVTGPSLVDLKPLQSLFHYFQENRNRELLLGAASSTRHISISVSGIIAKDELVGIMFGQVTQP